MKFRLLLPVFVFLSAFVAAGATVPLYVNTTRVQSPPNAAPQIDAITFVNENFFEVNDFSVTPLPYSSVHTEHFRNEANGVMFGHPGYFFEYIDGNFRGPMLSWQNKGSISSFSSPTNRFLGFTAANFLLVNSETITNSGSLNVTGDGLLRLSGDIVNLTRGRLRTGPSPDFSSSFGAFYLGDTNYFNDVGVTDFYWGAGFSNVVAGMGSLMQLNLPGGFPSFSPPYRSALHEAIQPLTFGGFFTNQGLAIQSFFFGEDFLTAAHTANLGGETVVQVAFVKTNVFEPGITVDVQFHNDFVDNGRTIAVGFHARDFDVALDRAITNSVFLLDALAFDTNTALARNIGVSPQTRRPRNYAVTKGSTLFSFGATNTAPNIAYTNTLLYRSNFTDSAVGVQYAAYAAQVTALSPTGTDPATFPGRIEILADSLNLRDARIRADSTLILRANNLTSNALVQINAPFINFDVGTTQPALVISNLAPPSVSRLSGFIRAWSATWRNSEIIGTTTNNYRFHVLFVDNTLTTNQPVTLNQFHARGTNIMIHDPLNVRQSLRLEAQGVHVKSNASLIFPANSDWTASTMVNIYNFTNDGLVTVAGPAAVGTDRGFGYSNFINRGTNSADSWSIRTDQNFENPGCMLAQFGGFTVNANRAILRARPPVFTTNSFFDFTVFPPQVVPVLVSNVAAKIAASTDINVTANVITLSNAHLYAGVGSAQGAVIFDAAQRITDFGPQHTNYLFTSGGVRVLRRPTMWSDLMGTYATVKSPQFSEVVSVWPANDLGAVRLGYSNNLALGKLTLDGGEESIIRLQGLPGKTTALYVDYIELLNNATNYSSNSAALVVDPSLFVYFAHANVPASKLGAPGSRFRWVSSFTGPLSTTNITYPSGNVYPVNISLAQDKDSDSDGDGIVNSRDRTPIYVGESVALRIARNPVQASQVLLSWQALANSTSYVEYKTAIDNAPWQFLNWTTAPANMRITLPDSTTGGPQRIYRVRVDLPP